MLLPVIIALAAASPAPAGAGEARQIVRDCNAHKFDTVVSAEVDGQVQSKRVRLCGEVGQSDSEWIKTLEDSAVKIEASENIAKPMRDAMATSFKVEIVRLKSGGAPAVASNESISATRDFTLKPRQPAPKPGTGMADFHGLPPLPDPVAAKAAEAAAYVPPPPILRPALAFQCFGSGAIAEGPCDELDRHGLVIVKAKAAVGAGVSLRFALDGEDKGDVALSGMRQGQRLTLALPSAVCRGTAGGSLEMDVMVVPVGGKFPPQRADTIGPVELHCE